MAMALPDQLDAARIAGNDDYREMKPFWQYYEDHYDGGPDYGQKTNPLSLTGAFPSIGRTRGSELGAGRYIPSFDLEGPDGYRRRLESAVFLDLCAPVVDFYAATVGNPENIMLTDLSKEMEAFRDDIDRQGRDFYQFMTDCRTSAFIYGHTFILVDQPAPSAPLLTAADEQRAGLRPYCVEIEPDHMLDWTLDATGRPISILYQVEADGVDEYREMTTTDWAAYRKKDKEYVKVAEGVNTLGRVPVVPLFHKREDPFKGCSGLKNAARCAQKATNWLSQLDQAMERQMFAQMWVKSRTKPAEMGVSSDFALHLNPEGGEDVGFVAPPTAPLEFVWTMIERLAARCNWAMGLGKATAATAGADGGGSDNQSGVAKQWDMFRAINIMKRMALYEQEAAKGIFEFAGLWMNKPFQGSITYSTTYNLSTLAEDIDNLIKAQAAQLPRSAIRESMKRVIEKMLTSMSPDVRAEIDLELDNATMEDSLAAGADMSGAVGQ